MRGLCWLCLCLLLMPLTHAQSTTEVAVVRTETSLPNNLWRFRTGDSLAWASPAYNDQHWMKFSPTDPLSENEALWKARRGWFRLPIRIRPKLVGQELRLIVEQFGTSELYLDGRRIATLRPPGSDSAGSQRITEFIPLRLLDTNRHVLAVRYKFRREPVYYATIDEKAFSTRVEKSNEAGQYLIYRHRWSAGLEYALAGVFLLLGFLHLLFYRANSSQPVNRLLGIMMLAFGSYFLLSDLNDLSGTLSAHSLILLVSNLLGYSGLALLLTAVYYYLNRRRSWIYWLVISLMIADAIYRIAVGKLPNSMGWVPIVALLIEYIRVSWLGKRQGDPDARLPWNSLKIVLYGLLTSFVVLFVVGVLSAVLVGDINSRLLEGIAAVMVFVTLLGIPLGLSLSLVRDYARTHQSLRQKLVEVEQLSAQTLAQEQEKQHLLSVQNETLERQVQERTAALHQSLQELQTTQAQLIQREKLASLGELTAGIAHEIQNPLNFVNNFAEVSEELVRELQDEHDKETERDPSLEDEILTDLQQNISKISQHGRRAASIVRGMLEHSRVGTGQKQPTNLNGLVEEYLRLSYHGLRANDKTFNVTMQTDLTADLPTLDVVPQDLGRVLLNLFNNAFFAVNERQKQAGHAYQPTVWVSTQQLGDQVIIRIRDNGSGIPVDVVKKVFQPFFTTKPTGQGTGLGLSISYDIVTKGHGGTLTVQSEPGVFTEFTITLPVAR